jgi:acyl carrier protein
MLFQWFLDHYADVEFQQEEGWITPGTTFHELSIESLDYVQWLLEAEERFGVMIPERDADRMSSVGDYLRYIRRHGRVKGHKPTPGSQAPLWDRELDG